MCDRKFVLSIHLDRAENNSEARRDIFSRANEGKAVSTIYRSSTRAIITVIQPTVAHSTTRLRTGTRLPLDQDNDGDDDDSRRSLLALDTSSKTAGRRRFISRSLAFLCCRERRRGGTGKGEREAESTTATGGNATTTRTSPQIINYHDDQ